MKIWVIEVCGFEGITLYAYTTKQDADLNAGLFSSQNPEDMICIHETELNGTIVGNIEIKCPLKSCQAKNDIVDKCCWKCGNKLS